MGYRKSVKGSGNEANEVVSHNRIYVEAGISGVILAVFAVIVISSAIIWMMLRNGSLLSTLVTLSFLGVFLGAGIVGVLIMVHFGVTKMSDMIKEVRVNRILSSTVVAGEVVSHYDGEEWTHLSSIHEQGKVLPQLPMKAESREPLPSEAYTVIDMHKHGVSFKKISEATQWTEYKVRQLCNQIDGKTP
jgi:hypothetical protein